MNTYERRSSAPLGSALCRAGLQLYRLIVYFGTFFPPPCGPPVAGHHGRQGSHPRGAPSALHPSPPVHLAVRQPAAAAPSAAPAHILYMRHSASRPSASHGCHLFLPGTPTLWRLVFARGLARSTCIFCLDLSRAMWWQGMHSACTIATPLDGMARRVGTWRGPCTPQPPCPVGHPRLVDLRRPCLVSSAPRHTPGICLASAGVIVYRVSLYRVVVGIPRHGCCGAAAQNSCCSGTLACLTRCCGRAHNPPLPWARPRA
jgi:hypothetical protein